MGKRGPKQKPTELHVLDGTFREDRHGRKVTPGTGRPQCPAWLDDAGKVEWKRLLPELEKHGLMSLAYRGSFAVYCQAWAELKLATEELDKEGRTVTNKETGVCHAHPAVARQQAAMQIIKQMSALYGLSPADRLSGETPIADNPNTISGFARKRG